MFDGSTTGGFWIWPVLVLVGLALLGYLAYGLAQGRVTHGEASTLHSSDSDLAAVRPAEFGAAAKILGIGRTELLDYPDGRLSDVDASELTEHVRRLAVEVRPSHVVAFDVGGVTGHPDHDRATAVAMAAATALALPAWGWAVPEEVAARLNAEFGTAFCRRPPSELDWTLRVDRTQQWQAIAAHASQSGYNPVLLRRLELLGEFEYLRLLA